MDYGFKARQSRPDLLSALEAATRKPDNLAFRSAITKAELLYGVAKRGAPSGLATRVREFLARVTVLDWSAEVVEV